MRVSWAFFWGVSFARDVIPLDFASLPSPPLSFPSSSHLCVLTPGTAERSAVPVMLWLRVGVG